MSPTTHAGCLLVLTMLAATHATAQDDRDRERPPTLQVQPRQDPQRARSPAREGGIPREYVAPESAEDGLQEGVPQLRERGGQQPRLQWVPPQPDQDWKLGVYAHNTESGVVITRVVRGSAAAEAGLERGDHIVTVGGYQVGYVGNQLYPLGHELQRQSDRRGHVLLLIQNVRNRELMNLDVRLRRGRFE